MDDRTKQTLYEFYMDYNHDRTEMNDGWMNWIHNHLNHGSPNPTEGYYTLELLIRWSIIKIIIYGLLPVIGSLAIGVGYMQGRMPEADDFGTHLVVIQTAWGISTYVVGAAGVTLAVLGVITQLADA